MFFYFQPINLDLKIYKNFSIYSRSVLSEKVGKTKGSYGRHLPVVYENGYENRYGLLPKDLLLQIWGFFAASSSLQWTDGTCALKNWRDARIRLLLGGIYTANSPQGWPFFLFQNPSGHPNFGGVFWIFFQGIKCRN